MCSAVIASGATRRALMQLALARFAQCRSAMYPGRLAHRLFGLLFLPALILAPLAGPFASGVAAHLRGEARLCSYDDEAPIWGLDARTGIHMQSSCDESLGWAQAPYEAGIRFSTAVLGPAKRIPKGMPRSATEAFAMISQADRFNLELLGFTEEFRSWRARTTPSSLPRSRHWRIVGDVLLIEGYRSVTAIHQVKGTVLAHYGIGLREGDDPPRCARMNRELMTTWPRNAAASKAPCPPGVSKPRNFTLAPPLPPNYEEPVPPSMETGMCVAPRPAMFGTNGPVELQ